MLLVGYESGPGSLMGEAMGGALYVRFFSITPLRTGRIWFRLSAYYDSAMLRRLEEEVAGVISLYGRDHAARLWTEYIPGQGAVFSPDTCSSFAHGTWAADPAVLYGQGRSPYQSIGVCAIPLKWEGIPEPQTLAALIGPSNEAVRGIHADLLGPLPQVQIITESPSKLSAKPGDRFAIPFGVGFGQIGGSVNVAFQSKNTGKGSSATFASNPGERINGSSSDQMPAVNPDESLEAETAFSVSACDVRNLMKTEEGARIILGRLGPSLQVIRRTTSIVPTDSLLVDTSGKAQILGEDLSYEGFIWADEFSAGPVLGGTAPATITFSGLKFLQLTFSREIAICENRSLLDASSKKYEYSVFPTPFMSLQRAKFLFLNYRPATPWESLLPVPKIETIRPAIYLDSLRR